MEKQKKYALRKIAGYGLVSCAVGLMLVGSAPTHADESASGTDATSMVEGTQDTSRITNVLNTKVEGYMKNSERLYSTDFIVDSNVAADKLPAIEYYGKIFNRIPGSYRRLVKGVQFINAEDGKLGDTSSSRVITIRANYIHPDQNPDFSDGLNVMFYELGHIIDFASMQGSGDSLWSIARDPYMHDLLTSTYPNDQRPIDEIFASAFGSWLKYRVLGESESNMQNLYNQFNSLFGDFLFNSMYNNTIVESEVVIDAGDSVDFTIFDWTGTFKSDKGEQLRDDAHLTVWYVRPFHYSTENITDPWELDEREPENMDDLHLEDHRFLGYGEPDTYTSAENVFTVPGRIGDYYLVSVDGNNVQHVGQNLEYTLKDNIYNENGKQAQAVTRESNFVYQKDANTSDNSTQSEVPNTSENGTQTEVPNTSENGTQTEEPNTSENGTQTEEPNTSENGTQTDKPDTSDNGTQTDKPDTSDNGTQTEVPNTSENGTQTEVPNTSENGTQTEVPNTSENGTQTEVPNTSENGTQTEVPNTSENGTQTEVPNTSENGTQTEVPNTSENGTQTEVPNTSDNGTQTDTPSTSEGGTQTEVPNTSENGTQTEVPNTSENGTQTTKPDGKDGTQTTKPDGKDGNTSENGTQTTKPDGKDGTQTTKPDGKDGTQTTKPDGKDGTQTDKPNTSESGTQTDKDESNVNKQAKSLPIVRESKTLPKTGTQATFTHMIGLALMGMASLFGFRKHKEE